MIFYADWSKMRPIYKSIRKNYKRWKYGRLVAAFFALLMIGLCTCFLITQGKYLLDGTSTGVGSLIVLTLCVALFPFIAFMFSLAVAKSPGRDILLARRNETIEIREDGMVIAFSPRFKNVINANYVEDEVLFSGIKTMEYEPDYLRVKIVADYTHNEYMSYDNSLRTKNQACHDAIIYLYDYYDRMDELKEVLFSKRDEAMHRGYETLDGGGKGIAELVAE